MQSLAAPKIIRSTCPYCGVGCGVVVSVPPLLNPLPQAGEEANERYANFKIAGDPQHPANFGRLCSKGAALAETLDDEGRLLHPLIDGQRASWDEALNKIADGFKNIIAEHGPDAVRSEERRVGKECRSRWSPYH